MEEVIIQKLVHGGQGLAELNDGRKVFVWNALPGERVAIRIIKQKRSYAEAIAETVITAAPQRISPLEANYLATSPWQIMDYAYENQLKTEIVTELFEHERVVIPTLQPATHTSPEWHYRNKMEYSFWGDDDGLHLALHQRGSHGKQIVTGSQLALPAIDTAANELCRLLGSVGVRAGDLKTVLVRCDQSGRAVASLFVKALEFPELTMPASLAGLRVYHSNPKSPASVRTKLLYEAGDCQLQDTLLGNTYLYDVDSFFQVNLPIFERALSAMASHVSALEVTDMYSGVGVIGLSMNACQTKLIELDPASAAMARLNVLNSGGSAEVVEASTEKVLEYITGQETVIFDPPRAGLHPKVIGRVLETMPPQIVYLSCNPATQARDLALLQAGYRVAYFEVFNFFPRTPHIETLAVLSRQ